MMIWLIHEIGGLAELREVDCVVGWEFFFSH